MNRRDMIIVATLINAGLLVAVFISAVKPQQVKNNLELASCASHEEKVEQQRHALKTGPIEQVAYEHKSKISEKKSPQEGQVPALSVLDAEVEGKKAEIAPKPPLKHTLKQWHTVTVEKGDVLERIARHHGVSVEDIIALNHLSSSRLQIGQTLKLPAQSKGIVLERKTEPNGIYYTVKGGDNPWTIAHRNGIQVEQLLELNNMDEEKAKRIKPGDKIKIK